MRDLVRQKTSLSEDVEKILNDQIALEAKASAMYLAMASWCDQHGFAYSCDFFYKQSGEERDHMLKIFKYVNDVGGKAISPEVTEIPNNFNSLRAVFEQSLEQEITNTQSINRIVDQCYKAKDYTTVNFLQWFLHEQIEEEFIARRALELFDVIGEEGVGLYMIDKKISEIKYKAE
ncbi:MAG TPA: ferritin [Chryseosolibacter sp.]|jgi:Ferritin-like protein